MNPYLTKLIIESSSKFSKYKNSGNEPSHYLLAKEFRDLKISVFRGIKDFFLISAGILSASFGLNGFLLCNQFFDGGATGISLLIAEIFKVPLYMVILVVNIPFILMGFRVIGKTFAIKTLAAIIGLTLAVALIQWPEVTSDKLLVSVFGGMFLGIGIGLSVRGGSVIDGTEILAIHLSRKFGTTIGDIIFIINVIIFSTVAYLISVETALYSIITYLAASKTLDFIVEGIEEYVGVTIVSAHPEPIRRMIIHEMERGLTVYDGKRGYGKRGEVKDVDIIYTVITRLELNKLNTEIKKIDANAFVVMNSVKDTKGGIVKKRRLRS